MQTTHAPPTPIEVITSPFIRFAKMEAAGGIVLLSTTVLALVWANSPWKHGYHDIFETPVSVVLGKFTVTENRHEWINDGLMSLFFFLVGLEIKREILVGELSSMRRAAFPFIAALGGMLFPALIYIVLTRSSDVGRGWAIPISTDIAFTLGLLTFLGKRVPISLKIFVTALAIVDDIFAVIVIAAFYTNEINYVSLGLALACIIVAFLSNILGVRNPAAYAFIGVLAWFCVLTSGVHATIAGILLAFTIPARTFLDKSLFLKQSRSLLDKLENADPNSFEEHAILNTLERETGLLESPLQRIEHSLQPWVGFVVMPLFALANAGVDLTGNATAAISHPVTFGVVAGLVVGKPAGILLFSLLAVKFGLALPLANVSWRQVFGAGCLCGIGFTMSLFVAGLAFDNGQVLEISKIAILAASVISAILGCVILARGAPVDEEPAATG